MTWVLFGLYFRNVNYEESYMEPKALSNHFIIELDGCDRIEVSSVGAEYQVNVIGCSRLLKLMAELKLKHGKDLKGWVLPQGSSHEVLLVRELILRARGEWNFPYTAEELCHCRLVPTRVVDRAIILGAHSPEVVSRRTSASTACGTCRPDVQRIIDYRLQNNKIDKQ